MPFSSLLLLIEPFLIDNLPMHFFPLGYAQCPNGERCFLAQEVLAQCTADAQNDEAFAPARPSQEVLERFLRRYLLYLLLRNRYALHVGHGSSALQIGTAEDSLQHCLGGLTQYPPSRHFLYPTDGLQDDGSRSHGLSSHGHIPHLDCWIQHC